MLARYLLTNVGELRSKRVEINNQKIISKISTGRTILITDVNFVHFPEYCEVIILVRGASLKMCGKDCYFLGR